MRVAIFSDVHGNLTALEAVLDDIAKQEPDLTLFAGDLCLYGTRPTGCVERLREENLSGVSGDTDEWISNQPLLSVDTQSEEREREKEVDDAAGWAIEYRFVAYAVDAEVDLLKELKPPGWETLSQNLQTGQVEGNKSLLTNRGLGTCHLPARYKLALRCHTVQQVWRSPLTATFA